MIATTIKRPAATRANMAAEDLAKSCTGLAYSLARKSFYRCGQTVPLDELCGEAMVGLANAIARFDDVHGVPFSAYATMVIKHQLAGAIDRTERAGRGRDVRFTDCCRSTAGDDHGDFDGLIPPDHRELNPFAAAEARDAHGRAVGQVDQLRAALPERWFQILYMRFAVGLKLEEIGDRLGVSRERIRQLVIKAMRAARSALEVRNLAT